MPTRQVYRNNFRQRAVSRAKKRVAVGGANRKISKQEKEANTAYYNSLTYDVWLRTLFPDHFKEDFAPHHINYWKYISKVEKGEYLPSFFSALPRKHGKSVGLEAGVVFLGARGKRKYAIYVMETQSQADRAIQNIAEMLESPKFANAYPEMAKKAVGKYGNSKGWRRNRLVCGNGFIVDGLGLDGAIRSIRHRDQRPDLIVLDDVDSITDTIKASNKKELTLTSSVLPAGSTDAFTMGAQNIIIEHGVFARIFRVSKENEADYLSNRVLNGVVPAVRDLVYERYTKPDGRTGYKILSGTATWDRDGKGLEIEERHLNDWGVTAYMSEAQHDMKGIAGDMFNDVVYRYCKPSEVPDLVAVETWCDPAVTDTDRSDKQAIVIGGADSNGILYILWAFEKRLSPLDIVKLAIVRSIDFGSTVLGIETNQGGDTWESVVERAWTELLKDGMINESDLIARGFIKKAGDRMDLMQRKVPSNAGSKALRAQQTVLPPYESGEIVHVKGTHNKVLENALYRFPVTKPHDLVDALYHLIKRVKLFGMYGAS